MTQRKLLLIGTLDREDGGYIGARFCFEVPEETTTYEEMVQHCLPILRSPDLIAALVDEDCLECDFFNRDLDEDEEPRQFVFVRVDYRNCRLAFDFMSDDGEEVTWEKSLETVTLFS